MKVGRDSLSLIIVLVFVEHQIFPLYLLPIFFEVVHLLILVFLLHEMYNILGPLLFYWGDLNGL